MSRLVLVTWILGIACTSPLIAAQPSSAPARAKAATSRPGAQAVPDAAAQSASLKMVKALFREQYSASAQAARRALAMQLLQQGIETSDDATARFVLLKEAGDVAAACGDAPTVCRAIDQLAATFAVDAMEMRCALLGVAEHACTTAAAFEATARCALAALDEAIAADQYEAATRLQGTAEIAAMGSKKVELIKAAQDRKGELPTLRVEYERASVALKAMGGTAGPDEGVNLMAGRFLCFIKGQWDEGLPLLARAGDVTVRECAQADLAEPKEASAQAKVGDGWWNLAQKQSRLARARLMARAQMWYRKSYAGLSGISKTQVQQRLDEMDAARMKELHVSPGLVAELFEGQDLVRKKQTRVDPTIEFDWGKDAPAPGMPKENFSIRWSGLVNAPSTGLYSFTVIANMGVRLSINDKVLIDNGQLSRKRSGERVTVKLEEGLHPFKLEYWDSTGEADVKVIWQPPGATVEEVVPAKAFWHDALER